MESFLRNVMGSAYEMGAGQSAPGGGGDAPPHEGHHEQQRAGGRGRGRGGIGLGGGGWANRPFAFPMGVPGMPPPPPGGPYPGQRRPGSPTQQQQAESTIRPPPASHRSIRQLPTVTVTPQDLVDETNRECCVCLEPHHLKDRVVRLPCAHIYHPACIVDWLRRSCTCPVCRYELPTDDAEYEPIRKKKMMARKPRYARYELDRMNGRELRRLAERARIRLPGGGAGMERGELIQYIVDSGRIEVIVAPEPDGEYTLTELRGMGVGRLRRAMEEAGVFFSKEDVVEKEDMVQIFVQSGRIILLPEEKEEEEEAMAGHHDQDDDVSMADVSMESIEPELEIDIEAVRGDARKRNNKESSSSREAAPCSWSDASSSQNDDAAAASVAGDDINSSASPPIDMFDEQRHQYADGTEAPPAAAVASASVAPSAAAPSASSAYPTGRQSSALPAVSEHRQEEAYMVEDSAQSLPNVTRQTRIATYADRTISQLKAIATERGIDVSDCIEKREIVRRIADDGGYVQASVNRRFATC